MTALRAAVRAIVRWWERARNPRITIKDPGWDPKVREEWMRKYDEIYRKEMNRYRGIMDMDKKEK